MTSTVSFPSCMRSVGPQAAHSTSWESQCWVWDTHVSTEAGERHPTPGSDVEGQRQTGVVGPANVTERWEEQPELEGLLRLCPRDCPARESPLQCGEAFWYETLRQVPFLAVTGLWLLTVMG